jgi:hypothetical protein
MARHSIGSSLAVAIILAGAACTGSESTGPSTDAEPALAASGTPATDTFEEPYYFETQCPQGFLMTNSGIASGHQSIFPDVGGVPARSQVHLALRGELVNTTSGSRIPNDATFTIFTNLLTGESTIAGGQFHLVAKGLGIVVLDAGTIRFDAQGHATFEGGRHDFTDADFEAQECQALS